MFKNSRFLTRPLYLQVRDTLVQRIVLGEWKPGVAFPNEFNLSQELGVSPGTVRKALDQLEQEMIVVRKQGRGTFVNDQSSSEMAIRFSRIVSPEGLRIEGRIVQRHVERGPANEMEAGRLGLGRGQHVIRIDRLHLYRDRPFMIERAWLPEHVFPVRPDPVGSYKICVIAQANQVFLKSARETVRPVLPTVEEAGEFGIPASEPIVELERTIITLDDRPIEWRIARCALGELRYVSEIA